ncbi:MAG TPA: class I SAM-dependent methyltransferase [Candidatus Elarobacter sp.]|jgi:SAM-dependent methyltransferase|nr:class I SAM-dependent methyltransferase [Candidatus Elarobacter sp.]
MIDTIEGVQYERLERPGCPLCGQLHPARAFAVNFGMTASVAECAGCRIAYQTPRPSPAASLAYMNMRWRSQDAYVADAGQQRARAETQLQLLAPLVPEGGRVLDFGAGPGTFVRVAREAGWEAVGVERSESARERARSANSVELLPDPAGAGDGFDAITMWDVVEHLRDPQRIVETLRPLLRRGGWMIFETGNWESWRRVEFGDAWGLYLFDHQFYFSPASLQSLVSRAGLRDFRLLPAAEAPPPDPPAPAAGPDAVRIWKTYQAALERWPGHASIDIFVAAARNA